MNNPHWKDQHDWALEDIRFVLQETWAFRQMLKKHPDDAMGVSFREIIKELDKLLKRTVCAYRKVYGGSPNMRKLREGVENERN